MNWLEKLTGETRLRLLRLVRGGARSINDLAESLGITDNAVRMHVAALERDGMVRAAGTLHGTGGKPARLYELTPEAEELFPKAYALVCAELLALVKEESGADAAIDLLRRVGRRLGERAEGRCDSPAERVAAARALLESIGGELEVQEGPDGWTLRSDGCPLSAIVAADPDACALAEALVGEVTGRRVVEQCDKLTRPRCTFHIPCGPSADPHAA